MRWLLLSMTVHDLEWLSTKALGAVSESEVERAATWRNRLNSFYYVSNCPKIEFDSNFQKKYKQSYFVFSDA